MRIPKLHAVREFFLQQDKTSNFTFFQWNEFGPSAGLMAGLGSGRVRTKFISMSVIPLSMLGLKLNHVSPPMPKYLSALGHK